MWASRKGNTNVEMAQSLQGESSQPNISTAEGSPVHKASPLGKLGAEMNGKREQRHENVGGSIANFPLALGRLESDDASKNPTKTHLKTGSFESTISKSPKE